MYEKMNMTHAHRLASLQESMSEAADPEAVDAAKKALENIDGLEAEMSKLTGEKITFSEKSAKGTKLTLATGNLVKKTGVMQAAFDSVVLDGGGSGLLEDGTLYVSMHLSWHSHDGGSNGKTISTAWYDPAKNKWAFRHIKS